MVETAQCACGATIPLDATGGIAVANCPKCGRAMSGPSPSGPGLDVFVSYAHGDEKVATAAVHVLESRGLRCWIAPRDVLPGSTWSGAIVDAIQRTRVMVLVFSSESNQSDHVLREVKQAVSCGNPILPFRIENILPDKNLDYFITVAHWLDAFDRPLEAALVKLAESVVALLRQSPASDPRGADVHSTTSGPPVSSFGVRSLLASRRTWVAAMALLAIGAIAGALALLPRSPQQQLSTPVLAAKLKAEAAGKIAVAERDKARPDTSVDPSGFRAASELLARGDDALERGEFHLAEALYIAASEKFATPKPPLPPIEPEPPGPTKAELDAARLQMDQARQAAASIAGDKELPSNWSDAEKSLAEAESLMERKQFAAALEKMQEATRTYQKIKTLVELSK